MKVIAPGVTSANDVFKELAALIELSCTLRTTVSTQQTSSKVNGRGLRFMNFAEHFWRYQRNGSELDKDWV